MCWLARFEAAKDACESFHRSTAFPPPSLSCKNRTETRTQVCPTPICWVSVTRARATTTTHKLLYDQRHTFNGIPSMDKGIQDSCPDSRSLAQVFTLKLEIRWQPEMMSHLASPSFGLRLGLQDLTIRLPRYYENRLLRSCFALKT